ncbi:MAG: DNA polymerase III subunit delta' [Chloroflexota bacterium]|nr:DNA polymerase III subunit delta' [Chloroflexota bacterium]
MSEAATGTLWFVGNPSAIRALQAAISADRLAHAYLFTGPPQVGKATLALWLAQTLLCEHRPAGAPSPCGTCRACLRIARGTHPDVQTFSLERQARDNDRATASHELGIGTVREIVREIDLLPFEAERKVYIIKDADTLTEEAANSLLKTLEEPPSYATLVMVAAEATNLPETIRSRCAVLRLHPVGHAEIEHLLRERVDLPPDQLARIVGLAVGRPGWALQAASDPSLLQTHDENVAALLQALEGGAVARLALAEKLGKRWTAGHRAQVYAALFDWLGYWRSVMRVAAGEKDPGLDEHQKAAAERLARHGVDATSRAAGRTLEAISQLDANVNTRMAVETLLLDLP